MSFPYKHWTTEECEKLSDLGILTAPYELVEGVIIDKMGQNGNHARLICALLAILTRLFGVERVRVQLPLRIEGEEGRFNEPLPDVAITRETYRAYKENPSPADMLLVIEVSDSSLRFDLHTKALLYARAGVLEYWVLDAENRRMIVHRSSDSQGYTDITEWSMEESITPLTLPEAQLSLKSLFEEDDISSEPASH